MGTQVEFDDNSIRQAVKELKWHAIWIALFLKRERDFDRDETLDFIADLAAESRNARALSAKLKDITNTPERGAYLADMIYSRARLISMERRDADGLLCAEEMLVARAAGQVYRARKIAGPHALVDIKTRLAAIYDEGVRQVRGREAQHYYCSIFIESSGSATEYVIPRYITRKLEELERSETRENALKKLSDDEWRVIYRAVDRMVDNGRGHWLDWAHDQLLEPYHLYVNGVIVSLPSVPVSLPFSENGRQYDIGAAFREVMSARERAALFTELGDRREALDENADMRWGQAAEAAIDALKQDIVRDAMSSLSDSTTRAWELSKALDKNWQNLHFESNSRRWIEMTEDGPTSSRRTVALDVRTAQFEAQSS